MRDYSTASATPGYAKIQVAPPPSQPVEQTDLEHIAGRLQELLNYVQHQRERTVQTANRLVGELPSLANAEPSPSPKAGMVGTMQEVLDYVVKLYTRGGAVPRVKMADVLVATILVTGVSREGILSRARSRKYSIPRHMAMYMTRELTGQSLPRIGKFYGRDHSTIIYAIRNIERINPEGLGEIEALVMDPLRMIPLFFRYGAVEYTVSALPRLPALDSLLPKWPRRQARELQAA